MRVTLLFSTAALLLAAAAAHAQHGDYGDHRDRDARRRAPTHADSTRTLEGTRQIWTHVGVGWLGSPASVQSRYNAGLDAGASGDLRFANHLAARLKLDYHDLPSRVPEFLYINGYPAASNSSYGHGWLLSGLAGGAARVWDHLWLEAGAGTGYFRSGYPGGTTYNDPVTGQPISIPANSGWGGLWSVGARYEFKPTLRDRMLGELQLIQMQRSGEQVQFWQIRIGYRAF